MANINDMVQEALLSEKAKDALLKFMAELEAHDVRLGKVEIIVPRQPRSREFGTLFGVSIEVRES